MKTVKQAIQKKLSTLTYNRYFNEIPLQEIFDIIRFHGGRVVDESGNDWQGFLCGESGRADFDINCLKSRLILSWYRMPSGRYEITAYLS